MKKVGILVCLVLMLSHPAAWAVVMQSADYRAELAVVISGGGATVASSNDARFTSIGENNVYILMLAGENHGLQAGQAFLLGSILGSVLPVTLPIADLRAYTEPLGVAIPEKTWVKDADPYFEWRVVIEPASLIKEFWVGFDVTPDGSTTSYKPSYQFPDNGAASGKHVFYVLPVLYTENPDPLVMLQYEIWLDHTPPSLTQVNPPAGTTITTFTTPVSCNAYDGESGLDLSATTFTINGSTNSFSYDEASHVLIANGGMQEGKNSVMIKASDVVGNSVTRGWDFVVDTQPPSGTMLINAGETITHSAYVTINLDIKDTTSGVQSVFLSNDGVFDTEMQHPLAYQPVIPNWLLADPDTDGRKVVYAKFLDSAGNLSQTYTASITLKRLTPDTRIISGPDTLTDKKEADFVFEGSKPGCQFSYKLDNQGWTGWQETASVHFAGLAPGNHYFYVKAGYDANGDGQVTLDEEDATPAQWVWTIESAGVIEKIKQKILFWRR